MFFDTTKADIEDLVDDLFLQEQVHVSVLRLDKIHPVVSGNKLFKLHYFLQEAMHSGHRGPVLPLLLRVAATGSDRGSGILFKNRQIHS